MYPFTTNHELLSTHSLLCIHWHHHCPIPFQKVLLLHGLQLQLSPISFHLVWVLFKASHDKNRIYSAKCNTVLWHMAKIQGILSFSAMLWGVCRVESVLISNSDLVWLSGTAWWHWKNFNSHSFIGSSKNTYAIKTPVWHMVNILLLMGSFIL